MPQNAVILLRRDTAANWTSADPTLELGEMGIETDTRRFKFGDGATAWTDLPYGSGDVHYRYALNGADNIQADEVLLNHVVKRTHILDADFANSLLVEIEANPTANPWVATISVDGTDIGTISITSAGVITKATTGNLAQTVPAGSRIKLTAPASADATIAGFAVTFEGVIQ
jgi:hypothetical protein